MGRKRRAEGEERENEGGDEAAVPMKKMVSAPLLERELYGDATTTVRIHVTTPHKH